ncbi:2OG-Fe(II) oxygenase [Acinetobacter qingfengensis]|uniref:Oxidoreductase n=1 Tax=Acinetobacter qingfengensis TaxID=1262585 RepID=A0A1E7RE60_9GAMM|nr:2OG-Fe(II) oxygenase [Acinetobacter qingfengensis]KAA8734575.1 2OG-Fe(II) oxygenase [Acinetobacter qingfengensis]OEY97576.1 oxidoreductase [Acinetobacter qingfengensis]
MLPISAASNWNIHQLCDDLNDNGFALLDHAYSDDFFLQIREECLENLQEFKDAAIQNGVVSQIRSDHILWINPELPTAYQHIKALEVLSDLLNQNFYLGIKNVEAHFACYNPGEFYALHRDNPQQKNHRIISTVLYLQEKWQENWGGLLRLQDKHGNWHLIEPHPNRLAVFQSDLLHEVLAAQQQRLSITGWLRSDQNLW